MEEQHPIEPLRLGIPGSDVKNLALDSLIVCRVFKPIDVVANIKIMINFIIFLRLGLNNIFCQRQKVSTGKFRLLFAFKTWRHRV